jgi:hypothetical protein
MCLNGGTCMDNGKCLCAPGYASSRCQVKSLPNQCGDKLCLNDATCVINNENNYECQCKMYFTGVQCESSLNLCETVKPCQNGGSCTWNSVGSSYKCKCVDGYNGVNCNEKTSLFSTMIGNIVDQQQQHVDVVSSSLTTNQVIIILSLGITLPILVILIVLLVLRVNSNRHLNEKFDSADSTTSSIEDTKKDVVFDIEKTKTTKTTTTATKVSSEDSFIRNNIFDDKKNEKIICKNNLKDTLKEQNLKCQVIESVSYNNMMASIV